MSITEDRDDLQPVRAREPWHREDAATLHNLAQRNQQLMNDAQRFQEQQKAAAPTPGQQLQTYVAGNTASMTVKGGAVSFSNGGQASARASAPVPEGRVIVDGIETTVEAARAAGYDVGQPEGFKDGPATPAQQQRPTQNNQEQSLPPLPQETTVDEQLKITKAQIATHHAEQAIGSIAVQSMSEDFVASGEVPRDLPSGLDQSMVDAVVDGYVAQANAVLRSSGSSVEMLQNFLNENELREARLAVFKGRDSTLRELANRATERLARLPLDPAHFQQLTSGQGWEGVQITNKGGRVFVKAPEWTEAIEWGRAVRSGKISL